MTQAVDSSFSGATRVAFFGGSFDPPHLGHLVVARAAQVALELDLVLFAPVGAQPLKPGGATAGFADRLAMTQLAIADRPHFAISMADAPKASGQPNYTIDTLLALRDELPAATTLFCLMGADSLLALPRWHRAAEIPFIAPLIVASRPGEHIEDLKATLPSGLSVDPYQDAAPGSHAAELRTYLLRNPQGQTAPFYLLPGLQVEISATEIRDDIQEQLRVSPADRPGRGLLPGSVSHYIRDHGLYL